MRILSCLVILFHLTCILLATDTNSNSNGLENLLSENKHILKSDNQNEKSPDDSHIPYIIIKEKVIPNINIDNSTKNAKNSTQTGMHTKGPIMQVSPHIGDDFKMESGALLRGFYVLLGITMILLMYLGIRMFRLRKGSKPPTMVRKYGILASRGDVEMLPLPLSEDEDDDTVFELNNHINS